jgi:large subunit ribosomal protein L29
MKIDEMRSMTVDELRAKLTQLGEEQFNLRFRLTTQPLDDPLQIRKVRREIARVKTLIQEKEMEASRAEKVS